MSESRCLCVLWGLAIQLVNLGLSAQEDQTLFESVLNTSQLASASKRVQSEREAPADVSILTARELQALGYRTLGEALAGVVGFRTNPDRAYQNAGIRGLYVLGDQNTRLLVLLDGHTLNSPSEIGSSKLGEDLGLPLECVDHIEIIRGPASSLYGSNAFLGLVHVITRMDVPTKGVRFKAAGSWGQDGLGEAWANVGHRLGSARWNLLLTGFRRQGTATLFPDLNPETLPAELDQERRQSAYLRIRDGIWSFQGYASTRRQYLSHAPFYSSVGYPDNYYENRICFGELLLEPKIGPVHTRFRLFGDRNEFRDNYYYDGERENAPEPSFQANQIPDRSLGLELQAGWWLGEDWHLTLGYEHRWHRFSLEDRTREELFRTDNQYELMSTYTQVEWAPSLKYSLSLGLQHAQMKIRQHSSSQFQGRALPNPQDRWTPRLAFVWNPNPKHTLKLIYGEGFRNPTLYEYNLLDQEQNLLDNPGLKPESIRTTSFHWLGDLWKGGRLSCSVSDLHWTKMVQAVDQEDGWQQFQNQSEPIRGSALEVELRHQMEGWDLRAHGAAYSWKVGGTEFPNSARTQAGLVLIRNLGAWTLGGEGRYVGPRSNGEVKAPGFTVYRTSLRWNASWGWLQLSAEDLGNRRPWQLVAVDYDPISRIQEDGSTLRLTAGFRWGSSK